MNRKDIIILGTGGHSKVLIDIIEENDIFKIRGFTSKDPIRGKFCGYPILGDDSVLIDYLNEGVEYVALGVGGFKDNSLRKEVFEKVQRLGFKVATLIHPSCTISKSATIKEGAVLFSGAVINNDVVINKNAIIATSSTVDHESIIGSNVLVSAGVTVGANVHIEEGVLCALGCKIVSGVKIGKNILIGAGAVVVNDIIEEGTYLGIPAKLKNNKE